MNTTGRYILEEDGKTPKPCPDLMEWGTWMGKVGERRVAVTEFEGGRVSTVFLGLDHRFADQGEPILWETMIFGGPHDSYQDRYTSYDEAAAGHEKAVAIARGERENDQQ